MNKLVIAVKEYWNEQGISDIVLNNKRISSDVNSVYLKSGKIGDKDQYTEAFKTFGKIEQLDLALYVLDKIELEVGALPEHLRGELVELLADNRAIPTIDEIRERAEAHQRYVVVLELINDWNANMVGLGFSKTEDMHQAILSELDSVLKERTGNGIYSDFKTYLGHLIEDGKSLPSFADLEEMNNGFVSGI
ncbi:hypothetical protein K6L09_20920 [Burkholderia cepacia]